MKLSLTLVLVPALIYGAICLFVFCTQRRLQYFPDTSRPALPSSFDQVRELTLHTADGLDLGAWYWPGRDDGPFAELTIVIFHGNGGHRGGRLGAMQQLAATGAGVLLFDYRGYGENAGQPSERGLCLDGEAALAWVRREVGGRVVLLGQSLGGGIATELAARHAGDGLVAGLILQNAAASLVDIARSAYPWLPVGLLMRDRYAAVERMPAVSCPVLSIHAAEDRIVPLALGRRLFEAAPGPKTFWEIPGAGHNDLLEAAGAEYTPRIAAFLDSLGKAPEITPPIPPKGAFSKP